MSEGVPVSGDLPPLLRRGILALWCGALLAPAAGGILAGQPIYGDDHSSHMAAIHHLLTLIRNGEADLFCPTFNLGFPMYLYYQPLPHFSVALVHILSFGLLSEQLCFNLTVLALWCLYPLTMYLGCRRLGLGDTASLLCALFAPLVDSSLRFGTSLHSVMGLGLFTQLYSMVLLPLCVGWTWEALQRRGRSLFCATGLMVLVWLSHAFYGMVAATIAVVMAFSQPSGLRRSLPRLLKMGLATAGTLLFWLIPLAMTRDHMGSWPFGGEERWMGYGVQVVAEELLFGELLDSGRLPLLSLCLLAGIFVAARRWPVAPALRPLLVCFGMFLFFLMGRRTFGHGVDIQPANMVVQLFRYLGPVHIFGVILAGVGLSRGCDLLRARRVPGIVVILLVAALLAGPILWLMGASRSLFRDLRSHPLSEEDLGRVSGAVHSAVAAGARPGRIYSHTRTGQGAHIVAALMGRFTDQPMGQSYGVGMHDSLGTFYLEHLDPLKPSRLALYNFRFVLATPDSGFARQQARLGRKPVHQQGSIQVHALPGAHGYFAPADLSFAILGAPRQVRPAAIKWLSSTLPEAGRFGVVAPRLAAVPPEVKHLVRVSDEQVEVLEGGRWRPQKKWPAALRSPAAAPPGRVRAESAALNSFHARVIMQRQGLLALKVAYHPFWQVEVDGRPAATLMLTPAFLGVSLEAGAHQVAFCFRNPLFQKLLFLAAGVVWILWGARAIIRRRRPSLTRPGSPHDT